MAEHTTHYNITKPIGSEAGDVSVINANMDIIDGQMYQNAQAIEELANMIYPVGSIYLSVNNVNPSTIFGGTWEQIKDRFLLGAGDTYTAGATGGSADAVVVEHTHTVENAGQHQHYFSRYSLDIMGGPSGSNGYKTSSASNNQLTQNAGDHTHTINNAGVSGVGKNMPPYLTVYMWKRTA